MSDYIEIDDDLDTEIEKLEAEVAKDAAEATSAEVASGRLETFELSATAGELLDEALVNVAENSGNGIDDDVAREQVATRAALVAAANYDLKETIGLIVDHVEVTEAAGTIYSLCFAVQKAANFITNLKYRRLIDKRGGEAPALGADQRAQAVVTKYGAFAADAREEHREAPYGLGPEHEDWDAADQLVHAYVQLHDYLQLLAEAFGWDAERPMPYMFVQNSDGTFTQIADPMMALDTMEVRSQESRARRQVKQTQNLAAALAGAKRALLKAGKRKSA